MDVNEIKELLAQFDGSSLTEFELKDAAFSLYMNKNKVSKGQQVAQAKGSESNVVSDSTTNAATSEIDVPVVSQSKPSLENEKIDENVEIILSPIVGIVYLQAAPDKPQFKQRGDAVKTGEVVCIIEAMKLMNEVTSHVNGEVVEVLVKNEQMVEFNQPLFKVKQ